ncbi:hypothetical protein HK101_008488 [Irineochytrium annulatum]|nr:hypothetical protein HK101_008488 [Irineochytrium annulatum]
MSSAPGPILPAASSTSIAIPLVDLPPSAALPNLQDALPPSQAARPTGPAISTTPSTPPAPPSSTLSLHLPRQSSSTHLNVGPVPGALPFRTRTPEPLTPLSANSGTGLVRPYASAATLSPTPSPSPSNGGDAECGNAGSSGALPDPLGLMRGMKSEREMEGLKKMKGKRGRKLRAFYEAQNELIEDLLRPVERAEGEEDEEVKRLFKLKIAVYGSTFANLLLFVLQLVAAITSGSLALFATMADSFMDLASSLVLILTGFAAGNKRNRQQYPAGKKRFETAGIIVFSCIMGALSIQLIIEGVRTLVAKTEDVNLTILSLTLVGVALVCKIGLYFYCVTLSKYQSARILAQDHRNDIVFNSFGIALSLLGAHVAWWIDPTGAILIAILILKSWSSTAFEHIQMLVGMTASPAFLSRVTYLALTHPDVQQVDTVRAYHSGEGFFVEVDIVLPPSTPLCEAHDVGESLQIKIEKLQEVERAFVHLDYETTHKPEHKSE